MQINGEDYNIYKRVFEDIFTKEDWKMFNIQNALYKNFQLLVRLPNCESVDEAFVRLNGLKDIVNESNIGINDRELKVTLEPDDERKAWLITFFNNFRAIEKCAKKDLWGDSSTQKSHPSRCTTRTSHQQSSNWTERPIQSIGTQAP